MEVTDRIASLEQRVQMQEDEIQLLKSALADVVRRLNLSEEQQAMGSRRGPTKGNIQYICRCFLISLWLSSKVTGRGSPGSVISQLFCIYSYNTLSGLNTPFEGLLSLHFLYPHDVAIQSCFVLFPGWLVVNLSSFLLLDCVVLLNVLCFIYRPCFDEKVSLSRQQCWEAR